MLLDCVGIVSQSDLYLLVYNASRLECSCVWCVKVCIHACVYTRAWSQGGYKASSFTPPCLTLERQGLSLNLEFNIFHLGWQPARLPQHLVSTHPALELQTCAATSDFTADGGPRCNYWLFNAHPQLLLMAFIFIANAVGPTLACSPTSSRLTLTHL